jgi:hypothetical protein
MTAKLRNSIYRYLKVQAGKRADKRNYVKSRTLYLTRDGQAHYAPKAAPHARHSNPVRAAISITATVL